jgi:hypothetical protein
MQDENNNDNNNEGDNENMISSSKKIVSFLPCPRILRDLLETTTLESLFGQDIVSLFSPFLSFLYLSLSLDHSTPFTLLM